MRDRTPREGPAAKHLLGYMHGLGGLCCYADVKGYVLALCECAGTGGSVGGTMMDAALCSLAVSALKKASEERSGGLASATGELNVRHWPEGRVMKLVAKVMEGMSMQSPARVGKEGAAPTFHEFVTPFAEVVSQVNKVMPAVHLALGGGKGQKVVCTEETLTSGALGDGEKVATPEGCRRLVHYVAGLDETSACNSEEHLGARAVAVTQAQWLAHKFFPHSQLVRVGVLETHHTHWTLPPFLKQALEGSPYAKDPEA